MFEKNAWETIKEHLCTTLTSEAYDNWVARTSYVVGWRAVEGEGAG